MAAERERGKEESELVNISVQKVGNQFYIQISREWWIMINDPNCDPAAKTSVLQTAYRIAQEASTADDCSKSADTNIASTSTETASCAEKVHALTKFCKNFYGDNANMDGTLDMKKNLYHDKEVEKLLCNRLCNMCIISNSSTPSSEISGSFEKSSNSEGFSDNEYFDVSTKCLPPHQNIMINLTPLAPILRYKSQLKLLCQLWNSTHCFTTS